MDKRKFGNFIKESRIKSGYTQQELADLLFLDATAISKWERGVSYPDITLIPDICKYLNVSEHELIESCKDSEYRKMRKDAKAYNKAKNAIFYSFSVMYIVAIIICFIVNLAVNHTLSWSLIVFSSCLCGFTFCPTCLRFFKKMKLEVFILSTFASMFLLFLTCSIISKNYWVFIASIGTLLFYVMLFFPILFTKQKHYLSADRYAKIRKYFMIMYSIVIYALTLLLLVAINAYYPIDIKEVLVFTSYCFTILIAWSVLPIILKSKLTMFGISSLLVPIYSLGLYDVIYKTIFKKISFRQTYKVNLFNWTSTYVSGNVTFIVMLSFVILGIGLILLNALKKHKFKH